MKQLQGILLLFVCISVYPQQDTCLILSEIMFIPQSGNNEFIEIYNYSSSITLDLNGYKIKYYTAAADIIIDAGWGTLLPPLSYAVILEGDYDFGSGIYNSIIPSGALKLKISDNSFGATGMSNTNDRPVQLTDSASAVLDQRIYTADNTAGYSEEKIFPDHDSLNINWSNSDIFNGTPGKRNSVTLLDYDLAVLSMSLLPAVPAAGENVTVKVQVGNIGLNVAGEFTVRFYNDINFDSTASPDELIHSETYFNLIPGDSAATETELVNASAGNYNIFSKILFVPDEDTLNNTGMLTFTVYQGSAICDLIINEIMYAPSGGMPEWLELYNRSGSEINLKNRKISDNTSSVYITKLDVYLPADSFIVLSKDSSILNFYNIPSRLLVLPSLPSLNNSGDDIVVKDSAGIHFDSLSYIPEWGGNSGRSLERKYSELPTNDSANWGTSEGMRKGTPGWINSLTPKVNDLKINSFMSLRSYGIIGENIIVKAVVKNSGTNLSGNYILKFYNDINEDSAGQAGELINSINGIPLIPGDASAYEIIHTGYPEGFNYLIALVETAQDEDLSNNTGFTKFMGVLINEIRNDLVINEFMSAPASPEPEWIEIFNRSIKTIEFKNYMTADNNDTVTVNMNSLLLHPGEYLIISADSSVLNYYNIPSHLIIANLPSMNNTGDKIILLDSLGRVIDSLKYKPSWGAAGKSVERVSAEQLSLDSLNWSASVSKYNATPGYINSVTLKEYDIKVNSVNSMPEYPVKGNNVTISCGVMNNGTGTFQFTLNLYSDTDLDTIPDVLIETKQGLLLAGFESSVYNFNYQINNLDNEYGFLIVAEAVTDEDTSNNYKYIYIFPGCSPGNIAVNEIMYSPSGGEPEWVELFNTLNIPVSLTSWKISDVYSTPSTVELNEEIFIAPGGFYVIARDSSIINHHRVIPSGFTAAELPVLNNDRDGIVLTDSRGQIIDSLIFSASWGGTNGHSLERRSVNEPANTPFSWNSSMDIENSTPGRINNTAFKQYDLAVSGISFDPRFPVKDDDVRVHAQIKNFGSLKASTFTVRFYIDNDSVLTGDSLLASLECSNLEPDDSLSICAPAVLKGINECYRLRVEVLFADDEDVFNNILNDSVEPGIASSKIIINEIMYAPENGEPEWIEFLNNSEENINLNGWELGDVSSGSRSIIISSDLYIQPAVHFIITSDSSFNYYHPGGEYTVITAKMNPLGNISDGIILYDFREGIIDSVTYKSAWGGKNGYSLERVSSEKLSNDSSNWTSCLNSTKSTPGIKNSMSGIRIYNRNELVINEIMSDPDIDNCEFIEFFNNSADSINTGGWRIEDEKGTYYKLKETSYMIPPSAYFVLAADSLVYNKYRLDPKCFISTLSTSGLGLTNSGEMILLKDIKGNVIDSVNYSDKWNSRNIISTKNISLERINPLINSNERSNWSSSVSPEGATPGKQNSIYCINPNTGSDITVFPNPFSPDNDGFEDHCIINYKLKSASASLRIRVFDSHGREVRTVVNNYSSSNMGSIIFDGLSDEGQPLRMGIYIIFIEAADGYSSLPEILKTPVVIARPL